MCSFFPLLVFLSHALVCPSSWGYGLPRFGVAPRIGDTDSHALAWLLELGIGTPSLGVAPRVGDRDSHALVWPLELEMRCFGVFFFGKCSKGQFPLQNLSTASMVPKPKPMCAQT